MSQPALSIEETRQIARLARLALADEELASLRQDLARVLEHMDQLRALGVDHLEPLANVASEPARPAPDSPDAPNVRLSRAQFASIAPQFDDPYLLVPKVLPGEGHA